MSPEDADGWKRQIKTLKVQEADQRNAMRLARELMQQHREQTLALGAPCRALVADVALDIRPLEEAATNKEESVDDPEARRRRHETMAEKVIEAHESGESTVVVLLGADHDLSGELKATGLRVKYVRVTVPKVRELMGE